MWRRKRVRLSSYEIQCGRSKAKIPDMPKEAEIRRAYPVRLSSVPGRRVLALDAQVAECRCCRAVAVSPRVDAKDQPNTLASHILIRLAHGIREAQRFKTESSKRCLRLILHSALTWVDRVLADIGQAAGIDRAVNS